MLAVVATRAFSVAGETLQFRQTQTLLCLQRIMPRGAPHIDQTAMPA